MHRLARSSVLAVCGSLLAAAGQSQDEAERVAIVRALAMHPRFPLLDEITTVLDRELVTEVLTIVRDLAADGVTMLLATHKMAFAHQVSSKVGFPHHGVLLEQGPPEQITDPREDRTRAFLSRIMEAGRL